MASSQLQNTKHAIPFAVRERIETWLEAERDQLALWVPIALGAGVAAWFALATTGQWAAFMLLALSLALAGAALGLGSRLGRGLGWFGVLAAIGMTLIWWRADRAAAPVLARPAVVSFEAKIVQVDMLAARGLVRLVLEPRDAPALPSRVRVNVRQEDAVDGLVANAVVSLRARLMPPTEAAVPGAYDFARLAWFRGIGATGRALGPVAIVRPGASPVLADTRRRLSAHIQSRLAGGEGGIAAALATGDQGAIPEPDAEAMRRAGLAHLLSISGLHVTALVGATMILLLRLLALSPMLALRWPLTLIAAGGGAVAAIGYTLLTGAEVPTVRSCVAAILVLIGIAIGRDAITLRLVAAGAAFVLLLWPESLVGPSFQLSFAAVTAIMALVEHPRIKALLARREESWMMGTGRMLLGLLLTGLLVELALTPIAIHHFHKAGLYGAIANIVAIPLTTFVVMPIEAGALLLDSVGLGAPLWWVAGQALSLLLWIAHGVAAMPGAVAALPVVPDAAFASIVIGCIWIALWRTGARWLGLAPVLAGTIWALSTHAPDILVTGDGRHLAVRADRGYALLRPRAGDYVRDMLAESAGFEGELADLDAARGARCSPDACTIDLIRGARRWRLLATRSAYFVEPRQLRAACRDADIVVSERRLPDWCAPRWIKADRVLLARTGGLTIDLAAGRIATVKRADDDHPWADPPRPAAPLSTVRPDPPRASRAE